MAERQFNAPLKCLQSDSGEEFQALFSCLKQHGILFWLSCPYTYQQNGKAERKHRHLVEMGLTLLAQASMPLKYWCNAFQTSTFLIIRLPTATLQHSFPFKVPFNQKPKNLGVLVTLTFRLIMVISFPFIPLVVSLLAIVYLIKNTNACILLCWATLGAGFVY